MSKSSPPISKAFSSASSPPSQATSLPPFSTTSIARLQALYSDFSLQKQSNATSYHANVEWWRKALEIIVSSGKQDYQTHLQFDEDAENSNVAKTDRLVLHAGRELIERLKIPKAGKPLALGVVLVRHILNNCQALNFVTDLFTRPSKFELQEAPRSFFRLPLFMDSRSSVYDPGWLPARIARAIVGRPLWWALEHMGIVGDEGILNSLTGSTGSGSGGRRGHERDTTWWGDYVILSLVEKAADEVVERHERRGNGSKADNLYSFDEFRKAFGGVAGGREDEILRELDVNVLLKYLERDRRIIVVDQEVDLERGFSCFCFTYYLFQVIKFFEHTTPLEERTITPVDHGILELKTAVTNLHAQVDSLHKKIDE